MNQETWQFNVKNGKKDANVCVHLDLMDNPTDENIVENIIKYIVAFEEKQRTNTNKDLS